MAKTVIKGTRVESAGQKQTPVAGAPQSKGGATVVKGNRVSKGPSLPRKNDPPQTAAGRLGLSVGARVTSSKVKSR